MVTGSHTPLTDFNFLASYGSKLFIILFPYSVYVYIKCYYIWITYSCVWHYFFVMDLTGRPANLMNLLIFINIEIIYFTCVEPYDYLGRRGRKEPQACGTVSLKRLYVENRPYLVRGFSQHQSLTRVVSSQCDTSRSIFSMAEKYSYMKKTFRKRLAFGKNFIMQH